MKTLNVPEKIIVNRQTWLRGIGHSSSRLLTNNNMMCCLGFACIQAGCLQEEILDITDPYVLLKSHNIQILDFIDQGDLQKWVLEAITINDNSDLDDIAREEKLIGIFKKKGFTLEFIN